MSALGHKRTFFDVRFFLNDVRSTSESGHSALQDNYLLSANRIARLV